MSALSAMLSIHVERCRKVGEGSCMTKFTGHGNDFKLIPTAEMKTTNPAGVTVGVNCQRSVIIAKLWWAEDARCFKNLRNFCIILEKRPLMIKFSILCSGSFITTPIDMLCSIFVKFGQQEISEIMCCLSDKKTKFCLALKLLLLCGSCPKSARPIPDNVLRVLQISSKSVHLQHSSSRTREHRQNAP